MPNGLAKEPKQPISNDKVIRCRSLAYKSDNSVVKQHREGELAALEDIGSSKKASTLTASDLHLDRLDTPDDELERVADSPEPVDDTLQNTSKKTSGLAKTGRRTDHDAQKAQPALNRPSNHTGSETDGGISLEDKKLPSQRLLKTAKSRKSSWGHNLDSLDLSYTSPVFQSRTKIQKNQSPKKQNKPRTRAPRLGASRFGKKDREAGLSSAHIALDLVVPKMPTFHEREALRAERQLDEDKELMAFPDRHHVYKDLETGKYLSLLLVCYDIRNNTNQRAFLRLFESDAVPYTYAVVLRCESSENVRRQMGRCTLPDWTDPKSPEVLAPIGSRWESAWPVFEQAFHEMTGYTWDERYQSFNMRDVPVSNDELDENYVKSKVQTKGLQKYFIWPDAKYLKPKIMDLPVISEDLPALDLFA
jgi:hypothetical protein